MRENTIGLWETSSGTQLQEILKENNVKAVALSIDGLIVSAVDEQVRIYSNERIEVGCVKLETKVSAVAFEGEQMIVGCDDRRIRVYDEKYEFVREEEEEVKQGGN